jgi:nitrile hydratase
MAARFAPGDRVHVAARYPETPCHIRTPFYIRGKTGTVERLCGEYKNPEDLAFGKYDTDRFPLYRVRFDQAHVWPDYDGAAADKVEVEIFEHWLEPAEGN